LLGFSGILVLVLLLAAYAMSRAAERGSLLLGAAPDWPRLQHQDAPGIPRRARFRSGVRGQRPQLQTLHGTTWLPVWVTRLLVIGSTISAIAFIAAFAVRRFETPLVRTALSLGIAALLSAPQTR
jgi:hypothetical protein